MLPSIATMKFVSTRVITADVARLVAFYEKVTDTVAVWGNELFAEIPTPVGALAIGSDKTVPLFGAGSAEPGANRSSIIEFLVDDVDAEYERLRGHVGGDRDGPDDDAVGQPGAAIPGPGRQSRQPVHPGHRRRARQVRSVSRRSVQDDGDLASQTVGRDQR